MAYTPTVWKTGDVITAEKMNRLEKGVQNEQVGPQGPAGAAGATGPTGASAGFGTPTATVDANTGTPSVTTTSALGGVKMAAAVADAAAAPTQTEFNALLASLRAAGILASS